jgi:hypothetical protein
MKGCEFRIAFCVLALTFLSAGVQAQKARASVSTTEVTGTFRMNFGGKFRRSYDEIKIASIGRGKLRVSMDLLFPHVVNGEMSPNLGSLDDTFAIKGDTATYTNGQCTLTINFVRAGTIKVTQQGMDSDCGFGHNVMADGTYRKISSRTPKFDTTQ